MDFRKKTSDKDPFYTHLNVLEWYTLYRKRGFDDETIYEIGESSKTLYIIDGELTGSPLPYIEVAVPEGEDLWFHFDTATNSLVVLGPDENGYHLIELVYYQLSFFTEEAVENA